ncbi:MAG: ribosome biogenesis GTPase Der [Planctomycetes bacterium]|nr:ribosome biogenesis GTPase Der [Planctomycetota bacterium]
MGKSTLLNAMVGRRVSIVDPTAGTTRDRVTARVTVGKRTFEAVDTGGIGIVDERNLAMHVEEQIALAIERAAKIAFVVDAIDGLTPLDIEVAKRLRRSKKQIILIANKCEGSVSKHNLSEFYKLGFNDPFAVSARDGTGIANLLDEIADGLPIEDPENEPELKVAIVGKRNAGKSTFVNALAREERVIVNEIPGTTRDAVDVEFTHKGRRFLAIDTAGLRRKKSLESGIEFFSMKRAESAIRRADVVLLMFDCSVDLSIVDKDLARFCMDEFKPVVIVANKWDLAEEKGLTLENYRKYLGEKLTNLAFAPIVATSSGNRERVYEAIELARDLHRQAGIRVPTGVFNRALEAAIDKQFPSHGMLAKLYYGTQAAVYPPTFVLFVNDDKLFDREYERYLANRFRESFECHEIPLRIFFRKREKVVLPTDEHQVAKPKLIRPKTRATSGRKPRG